MATRDADIIVRVFGEVRNLAQNLLKQQHFGSSSGS
jgi:hypothetical protein